MIDLDARYILTPKGLALLEWLDSGRFSRLLDRWPFLGDNRLIRRRARDGLTPPR